MNEMCSANFVKISICFLSFFLISTSGINDVVEDKLIVIETEEIIRNVTSKLFSALNFSQDSPKSRQTVLMINYFTNITLMTQQELNIISIFSKVNNRTNTSNIDIDKILSEDNDMKMNSTKISFSNEKTLDDISLNLDMSKDPGIFYDFSEIDEEVKHILTSNSFENQFLKSVENIEKNYKFEVVTKNLVLSPERRVYKGHKIAPMQFPYLVSIHIYDNFKCAGSIIKSDLIITAASCVHVAWENDVFRKDPSFISVRVGSDHYNKGGEVIRASEINFHPSYNPKNLSNNIAVIRLVRHMLFNAQNIKKISYDTKHGPIRSSYVTIAGWGSKGSRNVHGENVPTELAYDELNVYTMKECRDIYTSAYVSKKNFCAGYEERGSGACNHDVGGPGVENGILTGIISFGPQVCGTPDAPTVFTKIGYYSSWIDVIVTQGGSKDPKDAPSEGRILRESDNRNYYTLPIQSTFRVPPAVFIYTGVPITLEHTSHKPEFTWYEEKETPSKEHTPQKPEFTWYEEKETLSKEYTPQKPEFTWYEEKETPSKEYTPHKPEFTWYEEKETPSKEHTPHKPEFTWYEEKETPPKDNKWSMPWLKWITQYTKSTWMSPWFHHKTTSPLWTQYPYNTDNQIINSNQINPYNTDKTTSKKKIAPWLKWYNYTMTIPTWTQKPTSTKWNINDEREYTSATPHFYYSSKKELPKEFWYNNEVTKKQPTYFTFHYDSYSKNNQRNFTKTPSQKQNKEIFQDISTVLKRFMKYIL